MIDQTKLNPHATSKEIHELCQDALDYKFGDVYIETVHIKLSA